MGYHVSRGSSHRGDPLQSRPLFYVLMYEACDGCLELQDRFGNVVKLFFKSLHSPRLCVFNVCAVSRILPLTFFFFW